MAGLRDHKAPGGAATPRRADGTGNATGSTPTSTDPNPRCRPGRSWGPRPHGAERTGGRGRGDRVGPPPALPAECLASAGAEPAPGTWGGPPAPPSRLLGDEGQGSGASSTRRAGKGKTRVSKLKGQEFNRRQRLEQAGLVATCFLSLPTVI